MFFVAENRRGFDRVVPYQEHELYSTASENAKQNASCFYDYGAPKEASFTRYTKGVESEFINSIVAPR